MTTAERIKGTSRERRFRKHQGYSERKRQNREITSEDQGDAKEKTKEGRQKDQGTAEKREDHVEKRSDAGRAWK